MKLKILRKCFICHSFISRGSKLGRCNSCSKKGSLSPRFGIPGPKSFPNRRSYQGNQNPNWKGGRVKDADGYILVLTKTHPHRNNDGTSENID